MAPAMAPEGRAGSCQSALLPEWVVWKWSEGGTPWLLWLSGSSVPCTPHSEPTLFGEATVWNVPGYCDRVKKVPWGPHTGN